MVASGCKWLQVAASGCSGKRLPAAASGWKWLEVAGSGWKWLEVAGSGWEVVVWVVQGQRRLVANRACSHLQPSAATRRHLQLRAILKKERHCRFCFFLRLSEVEGWRTPTSSYTHGLKHRYKSLFGKTEGQIACF